MNLNLMQKISSVRPLANVTCYDKPLAGSKPHSTGHRHFSVIINGKGLWIVQKINVHIVCVCSVCVCCVCVCCVCVLCVLYLAD